MAKQIIFTNSIIQERASEREREREKEREREREREGERERDLRPCWRLSVSLKIT